MREVQGESQVGEVGKSSVQELGSLQVGVLGSLKQRLLRRGGEEDPMRSRKAAA